MGPYHYMKLCWLGAKAQELLVLRAEKQLAKGNLVDDNGFQTQAVSPK